MFLSTALPRSGGDYVFQSRVWGGGVAFADHDVRHRDLAIRLDRPRRLAALVSWASPRSSSGLGATLGNPALASIGVAFTTAPIITVVSILNAAGAFALLVSGFKNYVSVQRWMVVFTAIAITTTIIVLLVVDPKTVPDKLNAFSVAVGGSAELLPGRD